MKKLFIPLVTLFLAVGLGSCDKINELNEQTLEDVSITSPEFELKTTTNLSKTSDFTFPIDKTVPVEFFQGDLEDYKDLIDHIKNVSITKLVLTVTSVEKGADLKFIDPTTLTLKGNKDEFVLNLPSDKIIKVGTSIELDEKDYKSVNKILNEKKSFEYTIVGGFNKEAKIKAEIHIVADVTVKIIK